MKKSVFLGLTVVAIGLAWAGAERPSEEKGGDSASPFRGLERELKIGVEISESRAFFGAPPPVPHKVLYERDSKSCMQCHAQKNRVRLRHRAIAPTPHDEYSQCLQCHVRRDDSQVPWRETDFEGLELPGKGSRAHDKAPPTVPHKLFMREHCDACHGPRGDHAIRTPHPYRSQCLQCHVPELQQDYTRPQGD